MTAKVIANAPEHDAVFVTYKGEVRAIRLSSYPELSGAKAGESLDLEKYENFPTSQF